MGLNNMTVKCLLAGVVLVAAVGIAARAMWKNPESVMATGSAANRQVDDDPGGGPQVPSQIIDQPAAQEGDRDDAALKDMIQDMEKDRAQQRAIRALKLRKQTTDLELEEQKSRAELNRLRNLNPPEYGKAGNNPNLDVKIIYLGGDDTSKEAILSVNGASYAVRVKDRLLENFEVVSITGSDVTMRSLKAPFQTATYQFKAE